MKHYSRRTRIHYVRDLRAGDLVDISASSLPSWAAVGWIGRCDDDEEQDERCEEWGPCNGVIVFADETVGVQHVFDQDAKVYARLLADADEDTIEVENEAQAQAHAEAYAAKVAAYQASLARNDAEAVSA